MTMSAGSFSGHSLSGHSLSGLAAARWARRITVIALLGALALPLGACGKKGPLDPPPGTEESPNPYPRPYPSY
jgi:hypothetical protein